MGIDWYDMIARRNGGYRGRAVCTVVGRSAEEVFEERLVEMRRSIIPCWTQAAGMASSRFGCPDMLRKSLALTIPRR